MGARLPSENGCRLLIYLLDGPKRFKDITDNIISNYYSVEKAVLELEKSNLVSISIDDTRYHAKWLRLTPLGVSVAKQLRSAELLLSGEISEEDVDQSIDYDASEKQRNLVS
mgnify:FL=1|jgi:predicted transcriptional regulator